MSTTTNNNNNTAKVLYIDYQGHPAPLSRCFHATASRQLSSSVCRDPPTTKTEVDSAYCPQCFSVEDAATAATLGFCETCKQCPLCMAVASVTIINESGSKNAFYQCGYCSYTSQSCGITTTVTIGEEGTTMKKEEFRMVTTKLAELVDRKMEESRKSDAKQQYQDLLQTYEATVKSNSKQQQPKVKRNVLQQQQAWSLEALEESLVTKQQQEKQQYNDKVSLDADTPLTLDASLQDVSCEALLMQRITTTSSSALLPLKMPLRSRVSIRCCAELQQGRPGILVKPKLNPLEGDSSLRSGHGQWWKKDSSAIHVIPKLRVVKSFGNTSFLMKVTNPTMSAVKLRLGPSNYNTGERITRDNDTPTTTMKHVLMDSLVLEYKNVIVSNTTPSFKATELVQLESVEDCFLEMGRAKLPEAVVNWKGSSSGDSSSIRLVASQKDAAWFEVNVGDVKETTATPPNTCVAIPIALQIQVGDGSWESSLVKPKETQGEPDLVTFDVLIAWEPASVSEDSSSGSE